MRIDNIKLNNGDQLEFKDFNVFIGGNGVGKTTVLLELFHKAADLPRSKFLWINEIKYSSSNVGEDLSLLKSSLAKKYEGSSLFYYSNATKNIIGENDISDNLRFSTEECRLMNEAAEESIFNNSKYRRPFVSLSSCDSRLNIPKEINITSLDLPPQDSINVLHRNKTLRQKIDSNIFDIFKYHLALLSHTQTKLNIGISKREAPLFDGNAVVLQDEYERIESWCKDNFIPITEAGHGIRSMIKMLASLLDPVNQVILIDEPEMHIYPSQKIWLGKQLVSLAANQGKQVFLVTHDPMVLQGILDTHARTMIFRVDRDSSNIGIIKSCELNGDESFPVTRNQEQFLQGLFYQRCIVVEGASDRSFYQDMIDDYPDSKNKDLGIIVAGGSGNAKHMAHIVSKIGLKSAFVFDLDVLLHKTNYIKDIFLLLGGSGNPTNALEEIFSSDPEINAETNEDTRWGIIKTKIGYTDKYGLPASWLSSHELAINEVYENLSSQGIFIVPNGALESWAPAVEPKVRFAELAPIAIRDDNGLKLKIEPFLRKILGYLEVEV